MKIRTILFICVSTAIIFVVLQSQNLWSSGSIVLMNMTHDTSWYHGNDMWITHYNEAIWLSHSWQYSEAKFALTPLLNDTTIPRKAEIAELYGDLIYSSSGSTWDTIRMYERSLSFAPSERVQSKIDYLKKPAESKTSTGTTEKPKTNTGDTLSGSTEREAKKTELQKTATKRAEYLNNNVISANDSRSTLERLANSVQSGSVDITQDW